MRIALVYRSFHLAGSLPRDTVELAQHLSRRHDVHVFSIGAQTERALAPACTFHDVAVSHIGDGRRFSARELATFARNAASQLAREHFDVIHTCAPSTWVADVLKVPGVARDEAVLQGIPSWRYAAAAIRHPGEATRRLLEHKALRYEGLRRIHVASLPMLEALVRRYGIEPEHTLVIPPSVNLDEFRPPEDKQDARLSAGIERATELVVLFCGSDFYRKGLERAMRALAGVRTGSSWVLLVVGGGAEAPYRRLADELGIGDRIRFLGQRSDAWRFYQAADLVLLPTRGDVWGVTPIEAMACGVPPIVSAAAGSATAIRNGEHGIVLPEPFSVSALREAIEALAADPQRRAAMGRAGIEAAKAHSTAAQLQRLEDDLIAVAEGRVGAEPIRRARGGRRRRTLHPPSTTT